MSRWLAVMLEEIRRKQAERRSDKEEHERRVDRGRKAREGGLPRVGRRRDRE